MNHRLKAVVAALVFFLGLSFFAWGLMLRASLEPLQAASIECHARNAGLVLGADDVHVYVYASNRAQQLVAEGNVQQPITLSPGRYDVRAVFVRSADRQSQWLRGIALEAGQRVVRGVEFSSGELSAHATVGLAEADASQVAVYLYKAGENDQVLTAMGSGQPVLVRPDLYDVRIVLTVGARETGVLWRREVEVKEGLQTKLNVAFHRGVLNLTALNAGQRLPSEAVTISAYRAADQQQLLVDEGQAGIPLGLAAGEYDFKATYTASHDEPVRWLRDVEVTDGETITPRVEFSSGYLAVSARLQAGEVLEDFSVYVYFYRAGDHWQPIAYVPAGETAVLSAGVYDVRANYFRSHDRPDIWLRDLQVQPGETVTRTISFASGKLLVRAYAADGDELIGDNVMLHVHAAGERSRPICSSRSGEILILIEGPYDIRVEDTRRASSSHWLEDIPVRCGAIVKTAVMLQDDGRMKVIDP